MPLLIANSRLGHPHRSLQPSLAVSGCPLGWTHVSWGSANAGSCAGFGAFPDNSSCEHGPLCALHALPPSSRAWLLQLCLTRDRHHLCLPSLRFVMVTTGAANAHAKASPPFLVSCATLRISTRAPPWMRLRALCSPRLSASRARLPLVVASGEWELGFAIGVVRPVRPGLPGWATSLWAPWRTCQR